MLYRCMDVPEPNSLVVITGSTRYEKEQDSESKWLSMMMEDHNIPTATCTECPPSLILPAAVFLLKLRASPRHTYTATSTPHCEDTPPAQVRGRPLLAENTWLWWRR